MTQGHRTLVRLTPSQRSFIAVCVCGWQGRPYISTSVAAADGRDHEALAGFISKETP